MRLGAAVHRNRIILFVSKLLYNEQAMNYKNQDQRFACLFTTTFARRMP